MRKRTLRKFRGRTKAEYNGSASTSDKLSKEFVVISPEGIVFEGKNVTEFCKEHGLNRGALSAVFRGVLKQHKGWTGSYKVGIYLLWPLLSC